MDENPNGKIPEYLNEINKVSNAPLNDWELEILGLVANGMKNNDILALIKEHKRTDILTVGDLKKLLKNFYSKLGVTGNPHEKRKQAIIMYHDAVKAVDSRNAPQTIGKKLRILVVGCGDICKRLKETWDECNIRGVELVVIDKKPADQCLGWPTMHTAGASFYNLDVDEDQIRFRPQNDFDICLISTVPENHIQVAQNLFNMKKRVKNFIFIKPVDADLMKYWEVLLKPEWASLAASSYVHAHYRNKRIIPRLKNYLPENLRKHGNITRVDLYITEKESIIKSQRPCMRSGVILDLAPQCFSVLKELLGSLTTWPGKDGGKYEKLRIIFDVDACRTAKAAKTNILEETFAIITGEITQTLAFFSDENERYCPQVTPKKIPMTLVMGKDIYSEAPTVGDSDIKGLLFQFEDGTELAANFSSNWVGHPGDREMAQADRWSCHNGINLPFFKLLQENLDIHAVMAHDDTVKSFLSFEDAQEVMELTELARRKRTHESAITAVIDGTVTNGTYENHSPIEKLLKACNLPTEAIGKMYHPEWRDRNSIIT